MTMEFFLLATVLCAVHGANTSASLRGAVTAGDSNVTQEAPSIESPKGVLTSLTSSEFTWPSAYCCANCPGRFCSWWDWKCHSHQQAPWGTPIFAYCPQQPAPAAAPPAAPSASPPAGADGSCAAFGCGGYVASRSCQCNEACGSHGNCCDDYRKKCVTVPAPPAPQPSPPPTPPAGADGNCAAFGCGGFVASRSCQCNEACESHGNCCDDYRKKCVAPQPAQPAPAAAPPAAPPSQGSNILTLYQITSPDAAKAIVAGSFRKGTSGWCGGAIYLTPIPHLTRSKYNPVTTQDGAIVEAKVNMGRICDSVRPDGCSDGSDGSCCMSPGGKKGTAGAQAEGCNSIRFDPGDGVEYNIWNPAQVVSKRVLCTSTEECNAVCTQLGFSHHQCYE